MGFLDEESRGITFVDDRGREEWLGYRDLAREVARISRLLQETISTRESLDLALGGGVAVLSRSVRAQVSLFWACVVLRRPCSILPAPSLLISPELSKRHLPAMLDALRPAVVVMDAKLLEKRLQYMRPPQMTRSLLSCWEELQQNGLEDQPLDALDLEDSAGGGAAYVQFTSGTEGTPKGVALSASAIMANVAAMVKRLRASQRDRGISWLPLYHDMGLFGGHVVPAFCRMEHVLMTPLAFLSRPRRWLEAIHSHRSSLAVAPGFAYDLCVESLHKDELVLGPDALATLRGSLDGAEVVRAASVEGFEEAFAGAGLRAGVLLPCYGLAEATLAVTMAAPGEPRRVESVDRRSLEEESVARLRAPPHGSEEGAPPTVTMVGLGRPLDNVEVAVWGDDGLPLEDGHVGEIMVKGPSLAMGYLGEEEPPFVDRDGERWLRTGDRGYCRSGQLFVTGRTRDVIILHGRNHDPSDLEAAAEGHPAVRTGRSVAFSTELLAGQRESVVLLVETEGSFEEGDAEALRQRVSAATGIRPSRVETVPRGWIRKTTSGKKMRLDARRRYEAERRQEARQDLGRSTAELSPAPEGRTGGRGEP